MTPVEDRLAALLDDARLDPDQLAAAYREGAEALVVAREDPSQGWRVPRLNALVGAAHSRLFRGPRPGVGRLWHFLCWGLPQRLWDQRRATSWAAVIVLSTALWTWGSVLTYPDAAADILPLEVLERIESRLGDGRWIESEAAGPELAASLLVHNASAAVEACALGVFYGLGAVWRLASNGAFLGAVLAVVQLEGQALLFWSFLLPHAVVEFAAVFLAGGAGLRLGLALVRGVGGRRVAFMEAARAAAEVMVAVAVLLALAALIEAFISSRGVPLAVGLAVDLVSAVALTAVLLRGRPST